MQDGPYARSQASRASQRASAVCVIWSATQIDRRAHGRQHRRLHRRLHAVIGALTALHHREQTAAVGVGRRDLREHLPMLESVLPEYDFFGHVRERSGAKLAGIVPPTPTAAATAVRDHRAMVQHLPASDAAIGRDDLASDPRVARTLAVWSTSWRSTPLSKLHGQHDYERVIEALTRADVQRARSTASQTSRGTRILARQMFEQVPPDGKASRSRHVPKLSETPATTEWMPYPREQHAQSTESSWDRRRGAARDAAQQADLRLRTGAPVPD